MTEKLSRREFLKAGLISLGIPVIAGCAKSLETSDTPTPLPSPTVSDVPNKTPTPFPATETPLPTPNETPEVLSAVERLPFNPNQQIPVLEQHNPSYGVHGREHQDVYMSPEVYERQLMVLQELGFYTPTEEEILGWLNGRHGLPERSVIIRIDLGVPYKDYEEGIRLLEEYGFRSLFFIRPPTIPERSDETHIGWDFIKEYVDRGVLIPGCHGLNHPNYTEIPVREALNDALGAKEMIEDYLEREIYFFAYPFDAENYEEELLAHFRMLFGAYSNTASAGNPLVGTFYPYIRGEGYFDWERFERDLLRVVED